MPDHQCLIAFDFGMRRTGVAVGQTLTGQASPLAVIETPFKQNWQEVLSIITEWQPDQLLVGRPLNLDGHAGEIAKAAHKFANRLADKTKLPVLEIDERMTSRESYAQFRALRAQGAVRRSDLQRLDAHAAKLILETWLNHYASREDSD